MNKRTAYGRLKKRVKKGVKKMNNKNLKIAATLLVSSVVAPFFALGIKKYKEKKDTEALFYFYDILEGRKETKK